MDSAGIQPLINRVPDDFGEEQMSMDIMNSFGGMTKGYHELMRNALPKSGGDNQGVMDVNPQKSGFGNLSTNLEDTIDLTSLPTDTAKLKSKMRTALGLDTGNSDGKKSTMFSNNAMIDMAGVIPGGEDMVINQIRKSEGLDKNWPCDTGNVKMMNLNCQRMEKTNVVDLARYIKNNQVDVMALQEIPAGKAQQLKKLLGPEWQVKTQDTVYPDMNGKAILSRYKITDYQDRTFDKSWNAGEFERRGVQHAQIEVGGRTINVFNTHLTNTGEKDNDQQNRINERKKQLKQLDEYVRNEEATHPGSSVIMGDLNQRGGLGNITGGRTDFNDSSVDHIIISGDLADNVNGHYYKDDNLSDHDPIFAQLNLRG